MDSLAGKLVLITGGARGIGLGMAQAFVSAGARVVLTDLDGDALGAARSGLARDDSVTTMIHDVTSEASWQSVAAEVDRSQGAVDILCNNAGVGIGRSAANGPTGFADIPLTSWDLLLNVNLTGVFLGTRTFAPRMLKRGRGGHIVNTASMAGFLAPAGLAVYSATKFAVVALSESLAAEMLPAGIGVSVLCPGGVRSDFVERSAERNAIAAGVPFVPPKQPVKMDARFVGDRVVEAIRKNEFYIFTHPEYEPLVRERFDVTLDAFGASAQPGYSDTPAMLKGSGNPLYAHQRGLKGNS